MICDMKYMVIWSYGLIQFSGAYCAMVIISLLSLPLELPKESPAWTSLGEGNATFLTNLPEWIAQCKWCFHAPL